MVWGQGEVRPELGLGLRLQLVSGVESREGLDPLPWLKTDLEGRDRVRHQTRWEGGDEEGQV